MSKAQTSRICVLHLRIQVYVLSAHTSSKWDNSRTVEEPEHGEWCGRRPWGQLTCVYTFMHLSIYARLWLLSYHRQAADSYSWPMQLQNGDLDSWWAIPLLAACGGRWQVGYVNKERCVEMVWLRWWETSTVDKDTMSNVPKHLQDCSILLCEL